ncbi:LacI family DNA-binding transcriptional regulator [Brooklawnia cerclae]|uniref:DNA-binding LacI/PurR family transcriptional regulator n=1 Tax=Brooklawnia cerclae TaxID=349934 RepID=A0ABX0SFW1_9ACTN|nr:LacI family DNA-binding transcriptional regulator [Brooklawnia cerclae]NIH56213.1 DNA-binding LacI/PurR family transcriptional regulator [Brooklawnia cerclae]
MATIADVAALAGVSKATASRTFTRPELVSPATAQRVKDAAERLGFVANAAARLLAGGRTGIVALVVPTLDNSFFTPVIAGAQARTSEAGLQLTVVVHPLAASDELTAFGRLARQVDGFIVVAPAGTDELVVTATEGTPAVLVDREIDGMASVIADTASAFGGLARRLIEAGHRRIVYVGGPAGSWQDKQRASTVRAATESTGAELAVVGPYPATFAAGVWAAAEVRRFAPTAVIPYATAIGLGIQHAYLSAGQPAPLVSSEQVIVDALGLKDVPAIDVDGVALGRAAADLLVERIASPGTPPTRDRLPVPMVWQP